MPCEEKGKKLKVYPILQEALWESSKEEHHLSDTISLTVSSSQIFQLPFSLSLQQDEISQMKGGPALAQLWYNYQHITLAKANSSES